MIDIDYLFAIGNVLLCVGIAGPLKEYFQKANMYSIKPDVVAVHRYMQRIL